MFKSPSGIVYKIKDGKVSYFNTDKREWLVSYISCVGNPLKYIEDRYEFMTDEEAFLELL